MEPEDEGERPDTQRSGQLTSGQLTSAPPVVPSPEPLLERRSGPRADDELERRSAPRADDELEQVRRQLHAAVERAEQYAGDLSNYKRHAEAQLARARETAQQEVLSQLGETIRGLELASRAGGAADPEALRQGVVMVLRGLEGLLERHGLLRIPAGPGQAFDPRLHEAVLVEPALSDGVPARAIVREIAPGFQDGSGRVVRPARVSVAGSAPSEV